MANGYVDYISKITKNGVQLSDSPGNVIDQNLLPNPAELTSSVLSSVYSFKYFSGKISELVNITNTSEYLKSKNEEFLKKFPIDNPDMSSDTYIFNLTVRKVHELISPYDPMIFDFYITSYKTIKNNAALSDTFKYIFDTDINEYKVDITRFYLVDFFISLNERIELLLGQMEEMSKILNSLGKSLSNPLKFSETAELVRKLKKNYNKPEELKKLLKSYDAKITARVKWCATCSKELLKSIEEIKNSNWSDPKTLINIANMIEEGFCAIGSTIQSKIDEQVGKLKKIVGSNPIFAATLIATVSLTPFGLSLLGVFSGGKKGMKNLNKAIKDMKSFFTDFKNSIKTNPILAPVKSVYDFINGLASYTNVGTSFIAYLYNSVAKLSNLFTLAGNSKKIEDYIDLFCQTVNGIWDLLLSVGVLVSNDQENKEKDLSSSTIAQQNEKHSSKKNEKTQVEATTKSIESDSKLNVDETKVIPQWNEFSDKREEEPEPVTTESEQKKPVEEKPEKVNLPPESLIVSSIELEDDFIFVKPSNYTTVLFKIKNLKDSEGNLIPPDAYLVTVRAGNFEPSYSLLESIPPYMVENFESIQSKYPATRYESLENNIAEVSDEGIKIKLNSQAIKNWQKLRWPLWTIKASVACKTGKNEDEFEVLKKITLFRSIEHQEFNVDLIKHYSTDSKYFLLTRLKLMPDLAPEKEQSNVYSPFFVLSPFLNYMAYFHAKSGLYIYRIEKNNNYSSDIPQFIATYFMASKRLTINTTEFEIEKVVRLSWLNERQLEAILVLSTVETHAEQYLVRYIWDVPGAIEAYQKPENTEAFVNSSEVLREGEPNREGYPKIELLSPLVEHGAKVLDIVTLNVEDSTLNIKLKCNEEEMKYFLTVEQRKENNIIKTLTVDLPKPNAPFIAYRNVLQQNFHALRDWDEVPAALLFKSPKERYLLIYRYDKLFLVYISDILNALKDENKSVDVENVDLPSNLHKVASDSVDVLGLPPVSNEAPYHFISPRIKWFNVAGNYEVFVANYFLPYSSVIAVYKVDDLVGSEFLIRPIPNQTFSINGKTFLAPKLSDAAVLVDMIDNAHIVFLSIEESGTNDVVSWATIEPVFWEG